MVVFAVNEVLLQDAEAVSFLQDNLLLIGIAGLLIFGYLLLLIRKRWKRAFRHDDRPKSDPSAPPR